MLCQCLGGCQILTYNWCHGPKCHETHTTSRVRGSKGNKVLRTVKIGLNITDAEIIRTNSTGLVIYNPKNLAERIKGMKNKNVSRADKIKARLLYENNNAESIN